MKYNFQSTKAKPTRVCLNDLPTISEDAISYLQKHNILPKKWIDDSNIPHELIIGHQEKRGNRFNNNTFIYAKK